MKIRWGRVIFVFVLLLLLAAFLWLHHNADTVRDTWSSFAGALSDFFGG